MRNTPRYKRDLFSRKQYSLFEFTKVGLIAFICIIIIGSFMRVVFG
ncbi:hypothetical protein LZ480_06715 [Solibacillus sp. MA9]|uniref:DUF4044 domain-containing protein n=1 Tax=Solibacillus palustris TaxID=2908203 RepID=A0ABS9UBI4_9BACL|nr:hypothetical protein [Solibacillus sp. MA9]MCH7321583.1 hypothetical protein [Solibacillus sp. MA9]